MAVSIDGSYRLLAARFLRKQAKQLGGQVDGIRQAEDIEFIHRARVATRRLRAGLRMFADCFDPSTVKRWQKAIRRVTEGLGDARDADVQTRFICGVLAELDDTECYPGIARLLVKLDRRREKVQPKVNRAIDELEASAVVKEISAETKKTISLLEKQNVSVRSPVVFHRAGLHILARLEELLSDQDCLADADEVDRHHDMRIAAKRLRYTMEICAPAYNGAIDDFISSAKEVQSFLGDIHDCDVWGEYLDKFLRKERKRIIEFFGHDAPLARLKVGIDRLAEDRWRQRRVLFSKLVDYWAELERQGLWENLRETVRSRVAEPVADESSPGAAPPEVHGPSECHSRRPEMAGVSEAEAEAAEPECEPAVTTHRSES
jgi:CHAD domain-containing protein